MNLIEQLFYDFNEKYFEEAKANGVDLGLQDKYTPIHKIENTTRFRFADYITAETKSVGVLFNTEFINYFVKELHQDYINNIKFTFFYDCQFDYEQVQDCIFFSNKNINIEMISIENIKDLDKVMAGKKFDIVFSNPPYNGNLDLKILKSLFEQKISDKIVFVHPVGYLLDKKFKTKLYNELRNTNYLESVNMFWGNNLFDIKIFMPCCISVWNTNKTDDKCFVTDNAFINWTGNESKYICKINDISIHGKIFENVKHFLNYTNNIMKYNVNDNNLTNYSVNFPLIRGGQEYGQGIYSHFYSIIGLDTNTCKCDNNYRLSDSARSHTSNGTKFPLWTFNTENERNNFINYIKSKFVRFLFSLIKTNPNTYSGELKVIPWLDFTQEWNDKKLCKEFGISEELWKYIDNFIPDYYDDYESGFEK